MNGYWWCSVSRGRTKKICQLKILFQHCWLKFSDLYTNKQTNALLSIKTPTMSSIINKNLAKQQTNKQTNTLLSPDTVQCTRGQNIKQIHRNRRQYLDIYNINTCKLNTLKLTIAVYFWEKLYLSFLSFFLFF
jgi:hypothetical protein